MKQRAFYHNWIFQLLVCFILVFLTRIPYLFGAHVYFDGDEAIVGIMARDLIDGSNFPVYFYGQQYGLSFFEVVGVALGILIFGSTTWALKLGGMLVFSIGISFLLRLCLKKNISLFISCIIILIMCCFPAWILWSMKPRGGYLTAFSCSCILLYIIQTGTPTIKTILVASITLAIGVHSQILITIPIGICYAWFLLKGRNFKNTFVASAMLILFMVIFKLPAFLNEAYWQVPLSNRIKITNVEHLIYKLPELWMGSYFYELIFPLKEIALIMGVLYLGFSLLIVFAAMFGKQKDIPGYTICLLIGGLISFFLISKISGGLYRYTLGLFTAFFLVLVLSLIYLSIQKKLISRILIGTLFTIGLIVAYQQKDIPAFWLHPEKNDHHLYTQLTDHLKKRHIEHLFVLDPMLQWQLNYSGFSSRCTSKKERMDRYVNQVNQCRADSICKLGLVGYTGYFNYSDSQNDWAARVTIINERFFVYEGPEDRHLKAGGFE